MSKPNFPQIWSLLWTFVFLYFVIVGTANAATFTVTKVADTNDGVCNADCSLREAFTASNTAPSSDTIEFDPALFGTPQTIRLSGTQLEICDSCV